ncbi:MAG: hypothetical protein J6D30_03140 [Clostridia bacterium]|nr:hypothetical protein [Clostridia bacterium]
MLCCHCNKNQATETYTRKTGAAHKVEYYCMACYEHLFFVTNEAEGERTLSACPYCGLTVAEFKTRKIVGCAHCYQTLAPLLLPVVVKMQGEDIHKGKRPPMEIVGEETSADDDLDPTTRARINRQCHELTLIIEKLTGEGNYEDAKEYAAKLSRMRTNARVEEDFVWRGSTNGSKKP